jgi:hypothetical protein
VNLTLVMILFLAGGTIAEQPASIMECQLVTEALARNELVEIDATDGHRYRVLEAECQMSDRYEAACEGEGA